MSISSFLRRGCLSLVCALAAWGDWSAAADWKPGDFAVVTEANTEFGLLDQPLARLMPGDRIKVTEARSPWVGGYVVSDQEKKLGWIHQRALEPALHGPQPVSDDEARAVLEILPENVVIDVDGEGSVHAIKASGAWPEVVFERLKRFRHLVSLDLARSGAGDNALPHVSSITSLERLYLDNTGVSDAGLKYLEPLARLEVLVLAGSDVDGDGLTHLRSLGNLRTLNLTRCRVQDEDLKHLSVLAHLEVLTLCHTPLTGDGLVHLKPLRNLRVLNLSDSAVMDPGLKHLEGMPSLKMLYLRGTSVTHEATEALDPTLKSCAIYQ